MPTLTDADIAKLDAQPKTLTDADISAHDNGAKSKPFDIGSTIKQYWDKINPVTQAQALTSAALHLPTTIASYGKSTGDLGQKAIDSFKSGDYAAGVRHTLSYFMNAVPGVGSALDEAGNKAASGDHEGAIADTAALATQLLGAKIGPGILDAATEPGAAGNAARAVMDTAKTAASKIPGHAIEAAGAGVGYMAGHEIGGYPLGAAGAVAGREIGKNIANKLKIAEPPAAPAYPPVYDEISKGLGGGAYKDLSAEAQHAIQSIADKLSKPKTAPAAPTPSSAQPVIASTSPPAKTINQAVDEQIAANRAARAPVPQAPIGAVQRVQPESMGVPVRPPLAQPLAAQPIAPEPVIPAPTPAPTVSPTLATPAPTPIDINNPVPEAYRDTGASGLQIPQEVNARSAIANKLANHLHSNGITAEDLDTIDSNPEARKLFWDNASQIEGLSSQKHYSASPATIAAAKVALKDLETSGAKAKPATPAPAPSYLAKNPKALAAAQAMAQEIMKPTTIGDLMKRTK